MQLISIESSEFWNILEQEPLALFDFDAAVGYIAFWVSLYQCKQGGYVIRVDKHSGRDVISEFYKTDNWLDMVNSIDTVKTFSLVWMGQEITKLNTNTISPS